jgi:hypothetical protein
VETTDCSDGVDNDGDGGLDLADPGCASALDLSELDPLVACDDGADNDGDGRTDFDPATYANPSAGSGDLGCASPLARNEKRQCQDGIDNDPGQDPTGLVDFDGGQSIRGACSAGACPPGVSDPDGNGVADPDPQCVGEPWRSPEQILPACGFGVELALLLPLLWLCQRAGAITRRS